MVNAARLTATFIAAFVFFSIIGFLLSIVIPLLLEHLPANVEPVLGPPIRVLEKVLPGGINFFGMFRNVLYALAGAIVREAYAGD
jgi:hypothetical protein